MGAPPSSRRGDTTLSQVGNAKTQVACFCPAICWHSAYLRSFRSELNNLTFESGANPLWDGFALPLCRINNFRLQRCSRIRPDELFVATTTSDCARLKASQSRLGSPATNRALIRSVASYLFQHLCSSIITRRSVRLVKSSTCVRANLSFSFVQRSCQTSSDTALDN